MQPQPSVSVIVPVHRAGDYLEALLKGLEAQKNRDFEVLLVGFQNKKLQSRVFSKNVRYLAASSRWPDTKRNLGGQNAKAPILAYIDEDCIPQRDWIESIIHSFDKNLSASALEGATSGEQKRLLGHTIQNENGGWYPTCNMAFFKKDFLQIKGFDENYHFFREDMDIVFKLKNAGKIVLFEPAMKVFHPERSVLWNSFFNEVFLVKGDVRLYKKFPKLYREQFGFLCRGSFKLAAVVWLLLSLLIFGIFYNLLWSAAAIFGLIGFRYFLSMKKFGFSILEGAQFLLATTVRDLLFPFSILYYWLTIHPKKTD